MTIRNGKTRVEDGCKNDGSKPKPVKNIIFFIGDGIGISHIALARYYSLFVLGKELNMTKLMNKGSTAYTTTHPPTL